MNRNMDRNKYLQSEQAALTADGFHPAPDSSGHNLGVLDWDEEFCLMLCSKWQETKNI